MPIIDAHWRDRVTVGGRVRSLHAERFFSVPEPTRPSSLFGGIGSVGGTVVGAALREAGSGPVSPFVLAKSVSD